MPAASGTSAPKLKATFVFMGTVKQVKAATVKHIAVDDRTLVVTVDHIIETPRALANFGGHEITVRLGKGPTARVGQEMIFHTYGWIFGDSIAVQAISQEAATKGHTALLSRGGDPVEHKRGRDLRERFDQAALVVSGRVAAVRLPAGTAAARGGGAEAAGGAAAALIGPVSEHNPHWREAVIEIDDVHKGTHAKNDIVIRFPASMDVRWYKAPKFLPGQQGFFMLHRTEITRTAPRPVIRRRARVTAAGAPEAEGTQQVYTALSPMDFQPYHDPGGIQTLIELRRHPVDR